jgi:glyoxylase-like metal-dependent hydrolase (beta-lactamase superfamily II)
VATVTWPDVDPGDRHAWEEPGIFQVAPGVLRIPLPLPNDGLHAVNVYAVVDGESVVLVDSGWALKESEAALEKALGELDLDLGSIDRFLITHVHRDHYTQAITIRRRFGTRISLGVGEKKTVDLLLAEAESLPRGLLDRLRTSGAAKLLDTLQRSPDTTHDVELETWGRPDDWLRGGTTIEVGTRKLEVIETPGHTSGHVVFHDAAAGLLFAGDHVLPHITPSIGFETAPPPSPLATYLASLKVVAAMQDSVLLPAHGPVTPSAHTRVRELLLHHEVRLRDTENAVRAGRSTGYEVAQALRWTSRGRAFAELDLFNQTLAVSETLAHLDVLVEQGRLSAESNNGVRAYRV